MWRIIVPVILVDLLLFIVWQSAFTEVDQIHITRLVRAYADAPSATNKAAMDAAMKPAFAKEFYGGIACIGLIFVFTAGGGAMVLRESKAKHPTSRLS